MHTKYSVCVNISGNKHTLCVKANTLYEIKHVYLSTVAHEQIKYVKREEERERHQKEETPKERDNNYR